jgi:heptose I phosphotransferase
LTLYLRDDFARAWQGRDPFAEVDALQGKIYRNVKGRRTLEFEFEGRAYFAKIHHGIGWSEIIKNLLTLRLPILGAENEWQAIARLTQLGVATMTAVAYGSRGWNPARRVSFIVTEALQHTISLEDYCARWVRQRPPLARKRRLLDALASISRTLHQHGICHRDYYLCHFLLHDVAAFEKGAAPKLSLIDLHRALIDEHLPRRWVIKDVAGLYFSALHVGLNRHDFLHFVKCYSGKSLREALSEDAEFWNAVQHKALQLDRKINH